ncbi:hypothetical protein ACIA5A_30350 [Micromonospora sp. NPDC051300]|uniref:hypothetical protein n=1 Tax=Micromonospora sp. NPDC051300 TaxID=3364286 RepID=UPI0037A7D90A
MTETERRYRWLLRAYPRAYRQYRADEMLETLLATAEDAQRQRMNVREAAALVVGGLRARTGIDRIGSRSALGYSALRLSALSLLVYALTYSGGGPVSFLMTALSEGLYNPGSWWYIVVPTLLTIALFAAAWGGYRLAFAGAILTVVVQHSVANAWELSAWLSSVYDLQDAMVPQFWPALLASLALLRLIRAPRTSNTRPGIWPVLGVAAVALAASPINFWWDAPLVSMCALAALAVVAAPVDARIPIVASALLLAPALAQVTHVLLSRRAGWPVETSLSATLILAAITVITFAAATIAGRRQARM